MRMDLAHRRPPDSCCCWCYSWTVTDTDTYTKIHRYRWCACVWLMWFWLAFGIEMRTVFIIIIQYAYVYMMYGGGGGAAGDADLWLPSWFSLLSLYRSLFVLSASVAASLSVFWSSIMSHCPLSHLQAFLSSNGRAAAYGVSVDSTFTSDLMLDDRWLLGSGALRC